MVDKTPGTAEEDRQRKRSRRAPAEDIDEEKSKKDIRSGMGLWFMLNTCLALILAAIQTDLARTRPFLSLAFLYWFLPFTVNIGLMLYFVLRKREQVAFGMLRAFAIALAIVACLGLVYMATCFQFTTPG